MARPFHGPQVKGAETMAEAEISGLAKPVIAIKCPICGSWKDLTDDEVEYMRIYICDSCKEAILWAKKQNEKLKEKSDG